MTAKLTRYIGFSLLLSGNNCLEGLENLENRGISFCQICKHPGGTGHDMSGRSTDSLQTSLLHDELHWLDVPERVTYKMGVMVYRCLHGQAPRYPADQLITSSTSLLGFLCVPQTDTSSSYLAVDLTHTAVGRFRWSDGLELAA